MADTPPSDLPADRREEVLTRLHEATRDLVRASDREQVGEVVIATADEVLGLDIAVFSEVDPTDGVLRPVVVSETAAARLPGIERAAYGPGTLPWSVFESDETAVYADISERLPEVDDSVGTAVLAPMGEHGLLVVGARDEQDLTAADVEFVRLLAANAESALDRTERESALREERDRIAALFENTTDAILEVRYELPDDPTIVSVNPAFEDTFGYDAESVVGRSVYDVLVPDEDREEARRRVEMAARGGQFEREVRRETADGPRDFLLRGVPLDDGEAGEGYAIYTDVTDRTEQTRTLGRLHETTRDLVRASDAEEIARRTAVAARDILGVPRSWVRLSDAESDVLRPVAVPTDTDEQTGDRAVSGPGDGTARSAFETGEVVVVEDTTTLDDDGACEAVASAVYLPLGDHGLLCVGSTEPADFSEADVELAKVLAANARVALERAEQERELRRRETELARQNERLDEFASVVSHDLRNPLSVARGYLDLLSQHRTDAPGGLDDAEAASLDGIRVAHGRIDRLIGDLLTLARQGESVGETEVVSLADVARSAWRTVGTADATLSVAGDRRFRADRDRLCTLFENLFRNAVSHAGADVAVTVAPRDDGFAVADDGPGVPPADRASVFERGYTTSADGTGFGLAIVREIVEAHGWSVSLDASDDGGACFAVSGVESVPDSVDDTA